MAAQSLKQTRETNTNISLIWHHTELPFFKSNKSYHKVFFLNIVSCTALLKSSHNKIVGTFGTIHV